MTLKEMKRKILALIEELSSDGTALTRDEDIKAKLGDVIGQVMFELCRLKKMPKYIDGIEAVAGEAIDFEVLSMLCGYEVYQLIRVSGAAHDLRAEGTVIKPLEDGVLEVECYVFPTGITSETADDYTFEISADLLEILPYGAAADLLKSDVSTSYGKNYADRYEKMIARLDPRYQVGMITVEGGVDI